MWLINQTIQFNPDHRTLKDADTQVQLNTSAARCLALFLQRPGEVISHDALLEEGWRSQGVHVTDNSLRQMLSMLRKHFMQLRVEGETFVTVHRQGYRLHEAVRVEWCAPPEESVPPPVPLNVPLPIMHLSPAATVAVPQPQPAAITTEAAPAPLRRPALVFSGMLIAAALVLLLLLLGMKVLELRDVVEVNYSHFRTVEGRYWYIQDDFTPAERTEAEANIQQLNQQLARFVQLVAEDRYIYVNRTQLADRFSWFICHRPIEEKEASCRSVISFDAD